MFSMYIEEIYKINYIINVEGKGIWREVSLYSSLKLAKFQYQLIAVSYVYILCDYLEQALKKLNKEMHSKTLR